MHTVEKQDMIPTEERFLCEKRISSQGPNPSASALDKLPLPFTNLPVLGTQ